MTRGRAPLLILLGTLLLQAAWIVAVPPYRGIDEFDHAYRAASVAHGYWKPDSVQAPNGRGSLIPVPRELVTDGTEVCSSYDYTKPDNCNPVAVLPRGMVTVASAAQHYFPAYYAAVGWPSLFLDGVAALYGMRLMSAGLCALVIALAAWSVSRWSASLWPMAGLVLALTPVTIYSSIVVAPNALEIVAGLCVWSALIGLSRRQNRSVGVHTLVLTVGACLLAGVRPLGPVWLGLTILTAGLAFGVSRMWAPLLARRRESAVAVLAVLAVLAPAIWWSFSSTESTAEAVLGPAVAEPTFDPWTRSLQEVLVWVFQSIAAFPLRNDPAPLIVYACGIVAFALLVGSGMRRGDSRLRISIAACAVISLVLPYAATVATVSTAGTLWQGRYTLPYAAGLCLLAAAALDRDGWSPRLKPTLLLVGGLCLAVMHVVSVANVARNELATSPLSGDPRWVAAPVWLVGVLALAGVALWSWAVVHPTPTDGRVASRDQAVSDATAAT